MQPLTDKIGHVNQHLGWDKKYLIACQMHELHLNTILASCIVMTGLEIRVDRWPESTKNPVGPPIQVRQWSGGLPKLCQRTLHLLAFILRLPWRWPLLCSLYLIYQPSLFIRFSSHLETPLQTFLRTCTLNICNNGVTR